MTRLQKQRSKLWDRISQCQGIIQGSMVLIKRICGKSNCRCQRGFLHGSWYLSKRLKAKTRMIYLSSHCQGEIRQGIKQYKRMKRLIRRLSEVNERILLRKG